MRSVTVRIDAATHRQLKELAESLGASMGDTVALAVRRLRQDRIGADLREPLLDEEIEWLTAHLD